MGTSSSLDFSASLTQGSLPSLRVTWLPKIDRDLLEQDDALSRLPVLTTE